MKEWEARDRAIEMLGKAGIDDETIKRIEDMGYFTAPASRKRHLSVPGGLARHSVNVTKRLVELTEKLGIEWPRPESPYLVGMLHDLVKCETYVEGKDGYTWKPSSYGGHGSASALIVLSELGIKLYPVETAAIVWHMGAFELGEKELKEYHAGITFFGAALIAAHTADMLASQIDEQGEA